MSDGAETQPRRALRRSRAARLLDRLLATGVMSEAELSGALVVPVETLLAYRGGELRMPVERQICLARVALERVPSEARAARALLGQAQAEASYLQGATETHMSAPATRRWP